MGSSVNALDALKDRYRELMNDKANYITADAACKDYADYRYHCGIIHGLALAERELLDMMKRIEEA